MTNEEAIEYLEDAKIKFKIPKAAVTARKTNEALDIAIKALESKPKVGHWFYDKSIENWRCSECNETPKTMGYCGSANFMAKHFKFCNHCGVRMVEPQERSDKE